VGSVDLDAMPRGLWLSSWLGGRVPGALADTQRLAA